jgi:hypothetical protein
MYLFYNDFYKFVYFIWLDPCWDCDIKCDKMWSDLIVGLDVIMRWIKFRIIGSYRYIIDYHDLLVVLSITSYWYYRENSSEITVE